MSDGLRQPSLFEQAMMEIRAQEKPKGSDHDDTKMCRKRWTEERYIPNNYASSYEDHSRCVFKNSNTYTKEKHFNDTLDIFLGYKSPSESVISFARSLPNNITNAAIRQEIKKQRKTGFALFLRKIRCIASGIEPKPVKWGDEAGVRRDFAEQEDELTKSLGERKNSINVWYKLYKLFQHNGVDVDIEDFPLPKPKKLKEYEEIMEKVWKTLG